MSARARRTPLQETPSRRTWGCLAVRVSTLRSGRSSRRAWEYHSPFGKFTSNEPPLYAVSRLSWRPLRHSFGTETHSRQGISPSAPSLMQDFSSRSFPPALEAPFDTLPRPRRRATPALADVQPRPRRRVAPPSPRPRSFHAGQERCRCPFSERFSLLSRLS